MHNSIEPFLSFSDESFSWFGNGLCCGSLKLVDIVGEFWLYK